MQANSEESPSLHVASLPTLGIVAFCFDRQIVLCKLGVGDKQRSAGGDAGEQQDVVEELAIWTDNQRIRCVSLMYLESANRVLVITGGDGKMVHCFNASAEGQRGECLLACGPHQKKIVALATAGSTGDIVFVDKFGEVLLLSITWNATTATLAAQPHSAFSVAHSGSSSNTKEELGGEDDEDVSGDEATAADSIRISAPQLALAPRVSEGKTAATFLLQHFCLVSHVLLTDQLPRRLLSMDREGRVRVSRFPNTYDIEQFLWNVSPQSPVTAALELPLLQQHCAATVVVLGDRAGRVAIWSRPRGPHGNGAVPPLDAPQQQRLVGFRRAFVFHIGAQWGGSHGAADGIGGECLASPATPATSSTYGIVALSYVSSTTADAHGILVAADGAPELVFIPLRIGAFGVDIVGAAHSQKNRDSVSNSARESCITATTAAGAFVEAMVQRVPLPGNGQRLLGLTNVSNSSALAVVAPSVLSTFSTADAPGCELLLVELVQGSNADDNSNSGTASTMAVECCGSLRASTVSPLSPLVGALRSDSFASLPLLDVFAHWRPVAAKDPRIREGGSTAAATLKRDRPE